MGEALTSTGRDRDTSKGGTVVYEVNQFLLFSFQLHIYLSGSSYKCEIKPSNLNDGNRMYLFETRKQATFSAS